MEILKKLTKKNLTLNKKRTIVTIIGIMLSVALITAVSGVYMSGIESLKSYEVSIKGNYHYVVSNVDPEKVEYIENNRKVEATTRMKDLGYGIVEGIENESIDLSVCLRELDKSAVDNLCIRLTKGRMPENENEILVDSNMKDSIQNAGGTVELGKELTIDLGVLVGEDESYDIDERIVDRTKKTYTVVGIAETDVRPVYMNAFNSNTAYVFPKSGKVAASKDEKLFAFIKIKHSAINEDYEVIAETMGVEAKYIEKVLKEKYSDSSEVEEVEAKLKESGCEIDWNQYLVQMDKNPFALSGLDRIGMVVLILCAFIVITSVYCIKNSFDISITEKIKLFGMLRSVGATKKQIRHNVMYEAFVLGIVGIPLGIGLGCFATFVLIKITDFLVASEIGRGFHMIFKLSPIAIGAAAVLGVVTVFFASLKSAFKASRIMPIDSIRNSGNIKIRKKKLGVPKIISKIFGIGGEISYKNMKRNKRKYRTTTISIIIVTAIFIGLNSIITVLYKSVDEEVGNKQFNIDVTVYSVNQKQDKHIEDTLSKVKGIKKQYVSKNDDVYARDYDRFTKEYVDSKDAKNVEEFKDNYGDFMVLIGLDDKTYKDYLDTLEIDKLDGDAILVNELDLAYYDYNKQETVDGVRKVFDYKEGETLNMTILNEKKYEKEKKKYDKLEDTDEYDEEITKLEEECRENVSLKIGKMTNKRPRGISSSESEVVVFVSMEKYNEICNDLVNGSRYEVSYECEDANAIENDLNTKFEGYDFYINNMDKQYKWVKNMLLLVSIFLYGFIIVVSLIGITNIFNTITTNMQLRKPEFAMLKSVGMTKKEFRRMIRLESIFLGVKSLFFGIIFGTIVSYLLYIALEFEDDFGRFKIPYEGIGISIIAVFAIITLIMTYSVKTNDKQNIIETIRNENI